MSFYFTRFVKQIKQTKLKVDVSKQNFNRYLDNITKSGMDVRKMELNEHPQDIQHNPYFWKHIAKSKLRDTLGLKDTKGNFNQSFRTQPGNIGSSHSIPDLIKTNMNSLAVKSKEFIRSLYYSITKYFTKVTNLDLKKTYSLVIERMTKSPAIKRIYSDLVYVRNSIKELTTTTMIRAKTYIDKYRDDGMNLEARNYYKQLAKRIQEKLEDPKHHYIKNLMKRLSAKVYSTRIYFSNSTEKMNTFIKSGYFDRNYYILKENLSSWMDVKSYNYNSIKEKIQNKYYGLKNIKFYDYFKQKAKELSSLSGIRNYIKGKFYKFLFYLFGLIGLYYFIKYTYHRLTTRSQDKKLAEALSLVRELKTQNETLMKHNEDLYSKLYKNN
jgi:hypothetical protein